MRRALAVALATVVALGACSGDDGSVASLCEAVGDADGLSTAFQGFDPTDPQAALDQLRPVRVTLGDLLDAAPAEVRDDLQVEIDYVQALIDALEEVPAGDPAAAAQQVQAVTDAHPKVQGAADALGAFTDRECAPGGGGITSST